MADYSSLAVSVESLICRPFIRVLSLKGGVMVPGVDRGNLGRDHADVLVSRSKIPFARRRKMRMKWQSVIFSSLKRTDT